MQYQLLAIMLHNMNHHYVAILVNEYNLSVYNTLRVIVATSDLIVYISSRIDTNSVTAKNQKKQEALELVVTIAEDLLEDKREEDKIWGSMLKQAIKRRKPGFNETYYGYRNFSELLEEAQSLDLLHLE